MVLTEEEAKTKWCPQVVRTNLGGTYPISCTCVASRCMLWRWWSTYIPKITLPEVIIHQERVHPGEGWVWDEEEHRWAKYQPEKRRGYCGITSTPTVNT